MNRTTLAAAAAAATAVLALAACSGTPAVPHVKATAAQTTPAPTFTDPAGNECLALDSAGYCPGNDPAPAAHAKRVYRKLTAHQWALIGKDPDAHAGETYIVYGEVTQFDANTGPAAFRADVGATRQYPDDTGFVNYPTNTVLDGDAGMLGPVVEKDLFTAKVTVTGTLDYDTQLGGTETVPELQIDSITVTGHASI